jgi:imidazoleglycerol phosphate synthase glutamine amidotransferase subunit HisH
MKLVIIDPGSGNLASVLRAFQKVAGEAGVAADIRVTRDAAEILAADRVVLPGQGAFAACRRLLDRAVWQRPRCRRPRLLRPAWQRRRRCQSR